MLKLTYAYICDACGEKIENDFLYSKDHPFTPVVPDKWTKVGEQLFCPKHEVKWEIETPGEIKLSLESVGDKQSC